VVHRAVNPLPRITTAARNGAVVSGAPAGTFVGSGDLRPPVYPEKLDAGLLKIAGVCILGALMTVLDTTVVNVAQRTFISQFHSTAAVVAWTMTAYTLALAAVIPLTGWAADRFGTKRLFILSLALFSIGSLLCAVASSIGLLITYRALQGLGGGMLMPLVYTILAREAGPARLGRLTSLLGVPLLIGPVCGPILGGWLIDAFSWPWIFLVNVPVGVIAIVLALLVFPKDKPAPSESIDVLGMLLLCPGLAVFLYGVSMLPERGTVTDPHVWIPAIAGLGLVCGFVVHALARKLHPLIDLRLFRNRVVTLTNAAMLFFSAAFYGGILLLPSYFQQLFHQTPLQAGLHVIPQGLGAMLTMPAAGRIMDRHGVGKVVLAGIALMTAGMGLFADAVWRQDSYAPLQVTGLVVFGMGMGATMIPLTAAAVQTLLPRQVARGSTLINVNQRVFGSVGTAVMAVILTSQFNHSDSITAANQLAAAQDQASRHQVPLDPAAVPPGTLQPGFTQQLMTDLSHAYAVVFVVVAVLAALAALPAVLLPRKPVRPPADPFAAPAPA
jgi:EmrB/QacA subfamily drug resistance transporter